MAHSFSLPSKIPPAARPTPQSKQTPATSMTWGKNRKYAYGNTVNIGEHSLRHSTCRNNRRHLYMKCIAGTFIYLWAVGVEISSTETLPPNNSCAARLGNDLRVGNHPECTRRKNAFLWPSGLTTRVRLYPLRKPKKTSAEQENLPPFE